MLFSLLFCTLTRERFGCGVLQDNQSPRGGGGGQGNQGVGSLQQSSGASFDRPGLGQGGQGGPGSLGMGNNGPLNLMDLPMVRAKRSLPLKP